MRQGILIPANRLLALPPQRQRQRQLGADAIPVGPDVAADAHGPALADLLQYPVNDLRMGFHEEARKPPVPSILILILISILILI